MDASPIPYGRTTLVDLPSAARSADHRPPVSLGRVGNGALAALAADFEGGLRSVLGAVSAG